MYALFLTSLNGWIRLLLAAGLMLILLCQLIDQLAARNGSVTRLQHLSDFSWRLYTADRQTGLSVKLIQSGYRSAALLILVFQSDDSAWHRVAIWHDQVSRRDFSYLHQQIAFGAEPPVKRMLKIWCQDLLSVLEFPSRKSWQFAWVLIRAQIAALRTRPS